MYSRFTLVDPTNTGLNSKTSGGAQAGEFTRSAGFLAYYEVFHLETRIVNWNFYNKVGFFSRFVIISGRKRGQSSKINMAPWVRMPTRVTSGYLLMTLKWLVQVSNLIYC